MVNKILATAILLAAISLFFAGLSMTLAEFFSLPAQQPDAKYTTKGLDKILERLQKAQAIQPAYSFWDELEGDILLKKSKKLGVEDKNLLQQATQDFQHAIKAEPANARLWAKFVLSKTLLGEIDDQFFLAYKKAYEYGGWEYQVTWILVETGFARWYSIDAESRLILKESLIRLYRIAPQQAIGLAETYGQLPLACVWVIDSPNQTTVCQKELTEH